jgi:hypothetical protein
MQWTRWFYLVRIYEFAEENTFDHISINQLNSEYQLKSWRQLMQITQSIDFAHIPRVSRTPNPNEIQNPN